MSVLNITVQTFGVYKQMNTFIQQSIESIKSDSKDIYYTIFLFQLNAVLSNFLFVKECRKIQRVTVPTKIVSSTTVFNIDNNQKCF